jgi:trk system potassium uptake protein
MFEAVSAFNTVGLSLGVTDDLEPLSRILTTALMFVGRIGLLFPPIPDPGGLA